MAAQHSPERPFRNELPLLLGLVSSALSGVGPQDLMQVRARAGIDSFVLGLRLGQVSGGAGVG